jgi:hypothetical protein
MMTKDFGTLKRKIYFAYHQDGLLDLMAGAVILGFGTFMLTDNVAFLMFGWFVTILYPSLKKRITVPRFGYVRFDSERKTLMRGVVVVGIGVLVVFLFFAANIFLSNRLASPEMQAWIQRYHMVPLSTVLFGLPALLAAILLSLKRFYLYGLLAVVLPILGAWLDVPTFAPIVAVGFVALVIGVGFLANFLKQHPLSDEESSPNVSG